MSDKNDLIFEDNKWNKSNKEYFNYIKKLDFYFSKKFQCKNILGGREGKDGISHEILSNFGAYSGTANISRLLYSYEIYKKVLNLSGDIAEIGIYKGNNFLYWAKLIKLFEPYNLTQVYGFDWFEGMKTSLQDDSEQEGKYIGSYEYLKEIVKWQELENIALIFKMNIITEAKKFMEERPYLRFKILYIDCGIKEVMEVAYKYFYPRLVQGGILLMDHFNYAVSPSESDIINHYIGKNKIYQMPFARQPSGYIIKED